MGGLCAALLVFLYVAECEGDPCSSESSWRGCPPRNSSLRKGIANNAGDVVNLPRGDKFSLSFTFPFSFSFLNCVGRFPTMKKEIKKEK